MFPSRKPFRVKSRNSAKSSERKKCRSMVQTAFDLSESLLETVFPLKGLFEVAKVSVSNCPLDGRTDVDVVVYFIEGEPLFFDYDKRIFPTVYCLWRCQDILPMITTWPPVLPKLIGGADLMLPGVVGPDQGGGDYRTLVKGQVCGVNLTGNRSAVCVGVSLLSGEEMIARGMKGRGVLILHTYRDHLWEVGSKQDLPIIPVPKPVSKLELECESDDDPVGSQLLAGTVGELESGNEDTTLPTATAQTTSSDHCHTPTDSDDRDTKSVAIATEDVSREVAIATDDPHCHLSQDDLIFHCFASALKSGKLHRDQLPMLTSTFFRTYMLAECPKSCRLDVKKTRYKKLSVFLQSMSQEGIVEVKETSKGVDSITDMNTKHPMVKRYTPPDVIADLCVEEDLSSQPPSSDKDREEKITIVEMFMPSASSLPVFRDSRFNKSSLLMASQVREVMTSYVKREELTSPDNKRMVRMDPVLTSLFHHKGVEDVEEMSWNDLMKRFTSELRPAYKLTLSNGDELIRKGKPPIVKLSVVQRSGNKKATIVDNLDHYGIDCDNIAAGVQKMAAASASVIQSVARPGEKQVFVQGDVTKMLTRLLIDSYGLPPKYIEQENKVHKVKKKGK